MCWGGASHESHLDMIFKTRNVGDRHSKVHSHVQCWVHT